MILEINSLSKSYRKKKVLDNIDLTMEEGTVLAFYLRSPRFLMFFLLLE